MNKSEMEKAMVTEKATEMVTEKTTEMVTEKATEVAKTTEMETEKPGSESADFVTFRDDLFREVTNLVSEDTSSKIAILFNRPGSSSESDASMFSFGYPSAVDVVKTFLKDSKSPDVVPVDADDDEQNDEEDEKEDQSSEMFWWDDPKVLESEDPEELKAAVDSIEKTLDMLKDLKNLHNNNAEPKP